jgi:hypothetical protein
MRLAAILGILAVTAFDIWILASSDEIADHIAGSTPATIGFAVGAPLAFAVILWVAHGYDTEDRRRTRRRR